MDSISLPFTQRFQLSRLFQGEPSVNGPLELNRRRLFILPTRRGLGMVFTIFLLLLTAFIYNNNLVYLLAFLLASLFFVAMLHTYKALAGLVVQAGNMAPVFAGESAGFTLTVNNPTEQPRFSLSASLDSEVIFELAAQETRRLPLYAASQRRGWQSIGRITLSTSFPLGIVRVWSPLRFDSQVLVYPKPSSEVLPFPLGNANGSTGQLPVSKSDNDDFNGIRSYQLGDSPRQIHWKAYAKGQGLFSKQYASDVDNHELWLAFDQTPGNNLEERLSRLCRWILDAEKAGLRYGLQLPGGRIEPSQGPQHQADCLKLLALQ